MSIESFEEDLRRAIPCTQDKGVRIRSGGFGSVERGAVCPIMAILVCDDVHNDYKTFEYLKEKHGLYEDQCWNFIAGVDNVKPIMVPRNEVFIALGQRIRQEFIETS